MSQLLSHTILSDQAEKGGMVPLKGNLPNLVERSILGFETKCYTGKIGGHQPLFNE